MYEVKGKDEQNNLFAVCENAVDIVEAFNNAMAAGMSEIFAVYLSKIKEVFPAVAKEGDDEVDAESTKWYKVTVGEVFVNEKNGKEKVNKYPILIQSFSLDEANRRADEILSQGYGMYKVKIEETKIDFVV